VTIQNINHLKPCHHIRDLISFLQNRRSHHIGRLLKVAADALCEYGNGQVQSAQELQKAFILTFEKDLATMIFIFFCFFDQSGDDFFKSKTLQTFPSMSATMIRQM
jgi:hypothetical protein